MQQLGRCNITDTVNNQYFFLDISIFCFDALLTPIKKSTSIEVWHQIFI